MSSKSSGDRHRLVLRPLSLTVFIIVIALNVPMVEAQEPEIVDSASEKTDSVAPPPSFFSEVSVTATGSERDVFELATPVSVLRHDEIQRKSVNNAAELLRELPGVDVNGVGPNQSRPIIRGQRGLRVLFLENGLRLNNPRRQTDFGEISGLVDLDSVATVEVVRGAASVLYGSDAIGGVLNLISRKPSFGPDSNITGTADVRYSTAGDLARGGFSIDALLSGLQLQLGSSRRTSGDYSAPSGRFGNISIRDEVEVRDTSIQDTTVWGSAGFALTDRDELRLRFNRYRAGQAGFGFVLPAYYGDAEDFQIRILYPDQEFDRYSLSYFGNPSGNVFADSTELQLYRQENARRLVNDIDINIGPVAPGFPNSSVESDTVNTTDLDTWGVRGEAIKAIGTGYRHMVTYGIEAVRDQSVNTDFSRTITRIRLPRDVEQVSENVDSVANAPNATNTSVGVFVQDEIALSARTRFTAGARYNRVETRAEATPDWNIEGLDFSDQDVVGSLTATYQITESLNALASIGTAFRAPNIIERLFNGPTPEGEGFQISNPSLTTESSRNVDLGIKYRRRNAFMEAVAFRNDIADGIVQYFLSPADVAVLPAATRAAIQASGAHFVVRQENADRLRYQGVELSVGYHTASGFTFGGNYTHLDGERVGSPNPPTGDTYSAKLFGHIRYQPQSGRYWAEYHLRHNTAQDANVDPNEPAPPVGLRLPAFTVHGIGGGVRLFENRGIRHNVIVWMENATDQLYAEFSNATFFRPEPGRTGKVTYRVNF